MARVSFAGLRRFAVALLWLVVFLLVGTGLSIAIGELGLPMGGRWWLASNGIAQALGFGLATIIVGRWLDRHEWGTLGWSGGRRLWLRFALGLALGGAAAAAAIALTLADGARVTLTSAAGAYVPVAGAFAVGLFAAALSEELVFRGYPCRRFAEAVGPGPATMILAVGFAAAHLRNPEVSVFGLVNIALAGIWFSMAFFAGGMGLAWGLHAGWNLTLSLLFDAPVSGKRFDIPGVDYLLGNHAWVGGGAFGPEGGAVGTIALLAGIAVLLGPRLRDPRRWLVPAETPS
ncbi:MAG TPA: CPBP family intramembrane glutamic endopeptidase [Gemmatimonadales bacterium]|nr:CPBP family intramembrane glutamic endopeptidase [Gemmatimonadales bacterium]